jgi:hypothetical protein
MAALPPIPAFWQPPAKVPNRYLPDLVHMNETPDQRRNRKWKELTPAERQTAINVQNQADLFASDSLEGKLLRITSKFDTEIIGPTKEVLEHYKYVTIPFPVAEAGELNIQAAIDAYVQNNTVPDASIEGKPAAPDQPPADNSATAAANAVTKVNLLNVLLRQQEIIDLRTQLNTVNFDTRVGDALGTPGTGALNLRVNAKPYDGETGLVRFTALLSCFYGDRLVQECVNDNQAVYAYMLGTNNIEEDCKEPLIRAIIDAFPASVQTCVSLAEAAAHQVPPVAVVVGGARRYRQSRQSRPRHSRRKGRSQQGRSSRRQ